MLSNAVDRREDIREDNTSDDSNKAYNEFVYPRRTDQTPNERWVDSFFHSFDVVMYFIIYKEINSYTRILEKALAV